MLAAETTAQPRSGPGWPLSHAVAQALLSPFHGGHAPGEQRDPRSRLSAAGSAAGSPDHAGLVPSSAPGTPNIDVSAVDDTPSRGRVFLLATVGAAAGHYGTYYGFPLCRTAKLGPHEACPLDDDDVMLFAGHLATIAMTGGAAKLAGRSFWRSQAGSALGFAGGVASLVGIQLLGEEIRPRDFNLSDPVLLGILSLGHAAITTLIAG